MRIFFFISYAVGPGLSGFEICSQYHLPHTHAHTGKIAYGVSQESAFREPRAACGAIVGCLRKFSPENPVHVRLRRDLGEENFAYLTTHPIMANDGATDVTMMVAAAIVAIQGMKI